MKIKAYLILILLTLSSVLFTACPPNDGGNTTDYAAKAKEIVNDLYISQDSTARAQIFTHFPAILDILGIKQVDDPSEITLDGPVALPSDYVTQITMGIYSDLSSSATATSDSVTEITSSYYQLDDMPGYLDASGMQFERQPGYGAITADDLKGTMDYYINLYENNDKISREYFAGYLIGAISKNNPDVGTTIDQYTLDRLQQFLFMLDAFTLPENSPLVASGNTVPSASSIAVSAASGGSTSNWGSGAKQMNIKPQNTNQKVIDISNGIIKTYAYKFSVSGPQSIYCGEWQYTASVLRTCTFTQSPNDPLAPLDCSGLPVGVEGIRINPGQKLQEHYSVLCSDDPELATLVLLTKSDGTNCFNEVCSRNCPTGKEKSRTPGTTNVNGYVYAKFTGTDKGLTPPYPIFPATVVLKVKERVGDKIECHKN